MPEPERTIFISYAHPDRERVIPFYDWLEENGFQTWIDCRRIKPGQNWDFEIKRALDKATFFLAFISRNSYERRGYVQRELKLALDNLDERLDDDIYIIPVLLDDDVQIPRRLQGIHYIKASEGDCKDQIAGSVNHQLERLGIEREETQEVEEVTWRSSIKRESWKGLPGYEVELQLLELRSDRYPNIDEASDFIRGNMLKGLLEYRSVKFAQDSTRFNHGQDPYSRMDTYDAHCGEPTIVGKMLSVSYIVNWYGAGAAHPNHHFETFNFVLDPLHLVSSLATIFKDAEAAFPELQAHVRKCLYEVTFGDDDDAGERYSLDQEQVNQGTDGWDDFSSFIFKQDSIEVLFAPYRVAGYACGAQYAVVPYTQIYSLVRDEYLSALKIEHLKYSA